MLKNRIRHSNPQIEALPIENVGRLKRGFSLQPSVLLDDESINQLSNEQLFETIHRMEKENHKLQLENALFSSYLQRVENSKMIETYEEYEDKINGVLPERSSSTIQTTIPAKLPEIARRSSVKKSLANPSKSIALWSKLSRNWREYIYSPILLRVEQEKVSIAAYEIEQTQLDWERMKINANITLSYLDDILRSIESNELEQEKLKIDFQHNVSRLQHHIHEEKLLNPHFRLPAEFILTRITKRMQTHNHSIDLLQLNNIWIQSRIRLIDITIKSLDESREKMDEIDINFVRTRRNDYSDVYKHLDEKYHRNRLSQYPLFENLQKCKKNLANQQENIVQIEEKYQFLNQYFDKIQSQIETIQLENQSLVKENRFLEKRMRNIQQVPTITDYAHVMDRKKKLQHEISIWSQRVTIAEVRSVFIHFYIIDLFVFSLIRNYSYN